MNTAVFVKDVQGEWLGEVKLWKLEPPCCGTEYGVTSAVDLPRLSFPGYRTEETMVFPANADGELDSWEEIAMVPYKSHVDALLDMSYTVKEPN
jgi:hypothetical protein